MEAVSLKSLIAPVFYTVHKFIKENEYNHYWLKGGRGSTKSSFISIEIIINLMKDPKTHAICFRKVGNKLETSVYNQIKWAINSLGLQKYFKCYKSPLKIEYIPTGQLILFMGLDDPDQARSIKLPFGYIKIGWFEEANQFNGMKEIREVTRSFLRGGDDALIFYSYNPPEDTGNWVNEEADRKVSNRYVCHSTYLDVPPEWLGKAFIIEAEELKKHDPIGYRHAYLGEAVGTGLNVFRNIVGREISIKERKNFDKIFEGIDWGYTDPFVFIQSYYEKKYKKLYIFNEIYQCELSDEEAIERIKKLHSPYSEIIADSADPKSCDFYADMGLPVRHAHKPPGSINYGIKKLASLYEIIIDPKRCPNAYREFKNYSRELDKNGNIKARLPDKDNHTIDAVRYSLEDEFDY